MVKKKIPTSLKSETSFIIAIKETRGSALVLVLIMMTLIVTIIGVIMIGWLMHVQFIRQETQKVQALYAAEAGIHKTMWYLAGHAGKNNRWRPVQQEINLWTGEDATISVSQWGGYLKMNSIAGSKNKKRNIDVLVGQKATGSFNRAIHIGGTDFPLIVAGQSRIVGDVVVGKQGVKKGRIKGRGFSGDKLVEGQIIKSEKPAMPPFDNSLFEQAIEKYKKRLLFPDGFKIHNSKSFTGSDSSLLKANKVIHVFGDVKITNLAMNRSSKNRFLLSCSGDLLVEGTTQLPEYVEIITNGRISIKGNAHMENAILFAQKGIEISDAAILTAQLLSPHDIVVKDDVVLNYPSVIYCQGYQQDQKWQGSIGIQDRTKIRGMVMIPLKKDVLNKIRDNTMISIGKDVRFMGVIYSGNRSEHRGTVYGSIVTGEFFIYVSPTNYINYLFDAQVNRNKLPDEYLMPLFFERNPELAVLNWRETSNESH